MPIGKKVCRYVRMYVYVLSCAYKRPENSEIFRAVPCQTYCIVHTKTPSQLLRLVKPSKRGPILPSIYENIFLRHNRFYYNILEYTLAHCVL